MDVVPCPNSQATASSLWATPAMLECWKSVNTPISIYWTCGGIETRRALSVAIVVLVLVSPISYVGYSIVNGNRGVPNPANLHVLTVNPGYKNPTSRSFLVKGFSTVAGFNTV
jgi:hypothetical protein